MAQLKIYGISGSRALRSLWAIEEVGVEYEQIPTSFAEDSKSTEYKAINPNGRIPALVDGATTLFESMAINLYLARNYGGDLYPPGPAAEALTWQWSVWGISEIEPLQMQIVVQKLFTPAEKQNTKVIAGSEKALQRPLAALDAHLSNRQWLVADEFSIADLNLSGVMLLFQMVEIDVTNFPNISRWLDACYARPSLARARALS